MAAYSGTYRSPSDSTPYTNSSIPKENESTVHSMFEKTEKSPFSMQGILKKIEAVGMETDDLLLALVLFLMYRESGDKDLLILLCAMLLC